MFSEGSRKWAKNLDDRLERWRSRYEDIPEPKTNLREMDIKTFSLYIKRLNRPKALDLKNEIDSFSKEVKEYLRKSFESGKPRNESKDLIKLGELLKRKSQAIQNFLTSLDKPTSTLPYIFMSIAQNELPQNIFDAIKEKALNIQKTGDK